MPRSSARGYIEPVAAIAAVFAVVLGLTVYASVDRPDHRPTDRSVAGAVLEELRHQLQVDGVLAPARLSDADVPTGWSVNVTLATPSGRWTRGPAPPGDADRARRAVAVRLGPTAIRPGSLTVVAWR